MTRARALACALVVAGVACGVSSDPASPGRPALGPEAPPSASVDGGASADGGPVPAPFGLDARPKNTTCAAPARPAPAGPIALERVYANVDVSYVIAMAQMPGDGTRWFAASRGTMNGGSATIWSFASQSPANQPNVVATVGPLAYVSDGEGGLLGMAFHPKCTPQLCKLFVSWVGQDGGGGARSYVGYLTSTDGGATFVNMTEVLSFDQSAQPNHKGGGIAFGKDGYLYLSFGDGGGTYDLLKNGQTKTGMYSKVLRVDVDDVPPGETYGIPKTNPFAAGGGEPAAFAYGFRNPFRMTIDRETGDVWLGDVGEGRWEEIDKVALGGNYGWSCLEGLHPLNASDPERCPSASGLVDPVYEYMHPFVAPSARSVTGGYVYRGKAMPGLVGTYFFADFATGEIATLATDPTTGAVVVTKIDSAPARYWGAFAEDLDGEIYVMSLYGTEIWKLVPGAPPAPSSFPDRLSKTGCVDPASPARFAPGLVPYDLNAELWSDGAGKARALALPEGTTIGVAPDGDFDFPVGSVLVKTFSIAGKPVETRLFVRHDDGEWAGYSYEWLDDGSDAILLGSSKRKTVADRSWYFPSRGECTKCHTSAAGRSLGLELGQLNRDFVYASTNRVSNQLRTFEHIGLLSAPLAGPPEALARMPPPSGPAPVTERARAYLHANCSFCHRPGGGARGDMDLRFGQSFLETRTCGIAAESGDLGVSGARRLVAGAPAKSLVSIRARAAGAARMPPLATDRVDESGVGVVDAWIASITACP